MRSKDRLVEVMRSVNPHLNYIAHVVMTAAAAHIEEEAGDCPACFFNMREIATKEVSPHLRELAQEALIYLECGGAA